MTRIEGIALIENRNSMSSADIETGVILAGSVQGNFALDRRLPAAEQVYRLLRNEIITCRIAPHEAISENRICGMFGVSRSPVRVAVTRLAEDGLIEIFPQRGTFVAPIKLKQLREAQFARSALEVALAEEAARHWTEQHSAVARLNLDQQTQHAKSCDSQGFFLDNEAFHQLIARAALLEGVWTTVQSVKTIWDRIGHLANRVPAHTLEIIAEHKVIVQALANRSPNDAAAAMRTHLHSVDHAIARLLPLHASYFVEE
jgi:GntR family transcriptional regulator, rspAB operon transcriptional repressor